ncbi:MAG: protein kinase [Pirellulaceae bacterium]
MSQRGETELFAQALELPPEERQQFLRQACAGDSVRLAEAMALLEAHHAADSLLDETCSLSPLEPEQPGTMIGRYRLLQKLGEGGFGVVYLAVQKQPVHRQVAIKVIKAGLDTKEFIARFEQERQALAMMEHPGIAKILDAGATEQGRPYFVMELVKGKPITDYCDQEQLDIRQRLKLFESVCHAVQHAHQKGIIHRDLKPSNVLVARYDDQAVVKVIDFGVAKAISSPLTERTLFTLVGQLVGTWEYMSPEQAVLNQLDVDTRTDVYALGVILYQLLTGTTPIDGKRLRSAALEESLRIIREEEPPKPSTRVSTNLTSADRASKRAAQPTANFIRGELDWIVMKALEKDRKRRYQSAIDFASDVSRYLNDDIVHATPPSFRYRTGKFIRRHFTAVMVATVFSVLALGGMTGLTWFTWQLNQQKQQLAKRNDLINDFLMMMVVGGDADDERRALELAAVIAEPDDIVIDLLRGQAALQRGEPVRAVTLLQNAIERHPKSLACKGLLTMAHIEAGQTDAFSTLQHELRESRPDNPVDLLFVANARYGDYSTGEPLTQIRKALTMRDSLFGRYCEARMLAAKSGYAASLSDAEEGVRLFEVLASKFPKSTKMARERLVLYISLAVAQESAKVSAREVAETWAKAESICNDLEAVPNYDSGKCTQAWYYELTNQTERAQAIWSELLTRPTAGWQKAHAGAYLISHPDAESIATKHLRGNGILENSMLAMILARRQSNLDKIKAIYEAWKDRSRIIDFHSGVAIDMLAFFGDGDYRRRAADALLKDDGFVFDTPFDRACVEYLASPSESTRGALLATCEQDKSRLAMALSVTARVALSEGRVAEARLDFEEVIALKCFVMSDYYWAKAFLQLMDQRPELIDWLEISPR